MSKNKQALLTSIFIVSSEYAESCNFLTERGQSGIKKNLFIVSNSVLRSLSGKNEPKLVGKNL